MPLPALPPISTPDPTGDYARAQAWAMLLAKYQDSGNWAIWAAKMLDANITDLRDKLVGGSDAVDTELINLLTLIDSLPAYTPGAVTAYSAPTAPSYTAIPGYTAPTLGTFEEIPAVVSLTIPSVPSTAISHSETPFSDSLLTALKARIEADIAGVSAAETAMFERHEERVTAERAKNYTEITTQFSSRGFDMPPGALLAKQTDLNNESSKRLTDVSADIMMASVRESLAVAGQLINTMGQLNDNSVMREFEAQKVAVQMAIEGFKAAVAGEEAKGKLNQAAIEATVTANKGIVEAFLGEIEGQTVPIKAIADSNKAAADAYKAAVDGASASVQASVIPEELAIKQSELYIKQVGVKGDIAGKAAQLSVESSLRQVQNETAVLQGLAQSASQMVASALGAVNSTASFGFSGTASTRYDGDIADKIESNEKISQAAY
jgi:hypothetical protein